MNAFERRIRVIAYVVIALFIAGFFDDQPAAGKAGELDQREGDAHSIARHNGRGQLEYPWDRGSLSPVSAPVWL